MRKLLTLIVTLISTFQICVKSTDQIESWITWSTPDELYTGYFLHVFHTSKGDIWGKENKTTNEMYLLDIQTQQWLIFTGFKNMVPLALDYNDHIILQNSSVYNLLTYDPVEEKFSQYSDVSISNARRVIIGPQNTTWTCDNQYNLLMFDTNLQLTEVPGATKQTYSNCNFAVDKLGVLWAIFNNNELKKYTRDGFKTIITLEGSTNQLNYLHSGKDGSLFIWTYDGYLKRFNYDTLVLDTLALVRFATIEIISIYNSTHFVIGGNTTLEKIPNNKFVILPNFTKSENSTLASHNLQLFYE